MMVGRSISLNMRVGTGRAGGASARKRTYRRMRRALKGWTMFPLKFQR
jgi:hypothetical protein